MDNLQNFHRSHYCGDLRLADAGKTVSLCGWVQRQRDLGGLIFVDLRDRTGLLQLAFDDSTPRDLFEKAASLRGEYVIAAKGLVRERESKNPELPTGDIEVKVTELRLLAKAATVVVGGIMGSMNGVTFSATPSLPDVAISFGVSVGIGILFGYLPANKAAKLNPIDALRYD